jgi:hypothetical protein
MSCSIFAGPLQNLRHFIFIDVVAIDMRQPGCWIDIEPRLQAYITILI